MTIQDHFTYQDVSVDYKLKYPRVVQIIDTLGYHDHVRQNKNGKNKTKHNSLTVLIINKYSLNQASIQ